MKVKWGQHLKKCENRPTFWHFVHEKNHLRWRHWKLCTWPPGVNFENHKIITRVLKMGKAKKGKSSKLDVGRPERNAPLAHQMLDDPTVRAPGRSKSRKRQDEEEEVGRNYIITHWSRFLYMFKLICVVFSLQGLGQGQSEKKNNY